MLSHTAKGACSVKASCKTNHACLTALIAPGYAALIYGSCLWSSRIQTNCLVIDNGPHFRYCACPFPLCTAHKYTDAPSDSCMTQQ